MCPLSYRYACLCCAESLWAYWPSDMSRHALGRPIFAIKIAPSREKIWTPSNVWFLGPSRVNIPNSVTIGSAAFAGLTVTDRPTDRLRYSVRSNRPLLVSAAMQPNKTKPRFSSPCTASDVETKDAPNLTTRDPRGTILPDSGSKNVSKTNTGVRE